MRESVQGRRLRDCDVRAALRQKVLRHHVLDPNTLLVDEFSVCDATARADLVVVNGEIHGYEIKSDRDTLERLPNQVLAYSAVFDRSTIVVGRFHETSALALVPDWWGVKVAESGTRGAVHFRHVRRPGWNPAVDPLCVAALLWRDETVDELRRVDALRGYRSKRRDVLHRRLCEVLDPDEVRARVRHRLKARSGWRGR